jgi:hypothetical protein
VDLAKIKYEFLSHYYERHGVPLRARLFSNIASLNRWGSRFAPLANAALRSSAMRWLLDRYFGIDRRRSLPSLARTDFRSWFHSRPAPPAGRQKVVLFPTVSHLQLSGNRRAATQVLEHAGFEVIIGPGLLRPPRYLKGLSTMRKTSPAATWPRFCRCRPGVPSSAASRAACLRSETSTELLTGDDVLASPPTRG